MAYLKEMEKAALLFEYDAVNPKSLTDVDFSGYDPDNPEPFVKSLEGKAQIIHGVMSATSPENVVDQLNAQGLIPARIALLSGDKEGLVNLARLKKQRDSLMGIDRRPPPRMPVPPKNRWNSPNVLPWIIGGAVVLLAVLSWLAS